MYFHSLSPFLEMTYPSGFFSLIAIVLPSDNTFYVDIYFISCQSVSQSNTSAIKQDNPAMAVEGQDLTELGMGSV